MIRASIKFWRTLNKSQKRFYLCGYGLAILGMASYPLMPEARRARELRKQMKLQTPNAIEKNTA